jgi:transcriptional regulator with XRE-family HTH domain
LPVLCAAVKRTREAYQESQAVFAQRVGLSAMTVSKFERGETMPRDPAVLQALSQAAHDINLKSDAERFVAAREEALSIGAVNRMYPGPPAIKPTMSVSFQTAPEWRLMMIALFAVRYYPETVKAIEAASGPVRAVVDQVRQNADISRGIGPDFFRELEAHIKTLMEERAVKRVEDR